MKLYPKAIAQFDSCILRDWKTTDAYLEKGRAYFHMGNFSEALKTFNMAVTVSNTDPDAYYWVGRCYEAQHKKVDAINNYRGRQAVSDLSPKQSKGWTSSSMDLFILHTNSTFV
jgi:tetratricopeptide (TPR) repeat protein